MERSLPKPRVSSVNFMGMKENKDSVRPSQEMCNAQDSRPWFCGARDYVLGRIPAAVGQRVKGQRSWV